MINYIRKHTESLKKAGWHRELRDFEPLDATHYLYNGKKVTIFASNNYLGLTFDKRVIDANTEAVKRYGAGSGGSRLTTGSHVYHAALEKKLAKYKNTEAALVFSSGYLANIGVISAIYDKTSVIFGDDDNHASIRDGIRLSGAKYHEYRTCDTEHLEKLLKKHRDEGKLALIVTDSIFSMQGNAAPLADIAKLAKKYDCAMMADEAHALGVLGTHGRGLVNKLGLEKDIDIQMGTFSKAIGAVGGYIAGSAELIDWLRNRARSFVYDTSLPAGDIAAISASLDILESDDSIMRRLWENIAYFKANYKGEYHPTQTGIFALPCPDIDSAMAASRRLLDEHSIWIPAIRPPTVKKPILRLIITASHTKEEIDGLISALGKVL